MFVFWLLGLGGSLVLLFAGISMTQISSISGDSIAEAFYQDFGLGFIGLSVFTAMAISMMYARFRR